MNSSTDEDTILYKGYVKGCLELQNFIRIDVPLNPNLIYWKTNHEFFKIIIQEEISNPLEETSFIRLLGHRTEMEKVILQGKWLDIIRKRAKNSVVSIWMKSTKDGKTTSFSFVAKDIIMVDPENYGFSVVKYQGGRSIELWRQEIVGMFSMQLPTLVVQIKAFFIA